MLAVCVALAGIVGSFVVGVGGQTEDAPSAVITADLDGNEITLTHRGGDPLDVTELTVRVLVDGSPLDQQPDVPGHSSGFRYFSGDFSRWANEPWQTGETAGFEIAASNAPQPSDGSRVTVMIYADGKTVATARVR
jgi:FlaG/FlaF family flagellin (archaellin)